MGKGKAMRNVYRRVRRTVATALLCAVVATLVTPAPSRGNDPTQVVGYVMVAAPVAAGLWEFLWVPVNYLGEPLVAFVVNADASFGFVGLKPVELVTTGGASGGTVLGGIAIVGSVIVVTTAAVLIGDCLYHGECVWTTVSHAGGWRLVTGIDPDPNAAPIQGKVTVSCNPAAGDLETQCRNSSIRNVVTPYYYWALGSYWTCGEVLARSADYSSHSTWAEAWAQCTTAVEQCVTSTQNMCNLPRPEPRVLEAPAQAAIQLNQLE